MRVFFQRFLAILQITALIANNYLKTADERIREARFIDATENSLGTIESSEFTNARL